MLCCDPRITGQYPAESEEESKKAGALHRVPGLGSKDVPKGVMEFLADTLLVGF